MAEYKWWARSERRQVLLVRYLSAALKSGIVEGSAEDEHIVRQMLDGLTKQLARRELRKYAGAEGRN